MAKRKRAQRPEDLLLGGRSRTPSGRIGPLGPGNPNAGIAGGGGKGAFKDVSVDPITGVVKKVAGVKSRSQGASASSSNVLGTGAVRPPAWGGTIRHILKNKIKRR